MRKEELDNKINRVLSGWDTPMIKTKQSIWEAIIAQNKEEGMPVLFINKWKWVAAASIFVVAISITLFYSSQVTISTQQQATNFSLPDGSIVNLNVHSVASYNSATWLFSRYISLSGEGFFTVKKGEKFVVNTDKGVVSVLGTSFNVIARANKFNVECFTGKVAVSNGKSNIIITKGELVNESTEFALVKETNRNSSLEPNWIHGDFAYNNEQLVTVLNDISAHFEIDFIATNRINKLSFTGAWNKSMTLEEVLKIVCLPFNLEANSTDKKSYTLSFIED